MIFDVDDPIAAPASAPGPGARAILRVSGAGVREAVRSVFMPAATAVWESSRAAGRYEGRLRLEALGVDVPAAACLWPGRRSYTGQPVAELHLPGSPPLVEATLAALYQGGVRPARPGEFTLRAFLAGRLDLVRAEAVLGVIDASDHAELDLALRQLAGGLSGRLADVRADLLSLLADLEAGLDFVEEDIEFVAREEVVRRVGAAAAALDALLADASERRRDAARGRVVLAGLPNAGKSTLFNALTKGAGAIVSPTAGTTRDWLAADVVLAGTPAELVDTAGWEDASDGLSAAMQALREEQLERADVIVWCTAADASSDASSDESSRDERLRGGLGAARARVVAVRTKADLRGPDDGPVGGIRVSAETGAGIRELEASIAAALAADRAGARQMIGSTAARGRESLAAAREALRRGAEAYETGFGEEVVAAELRGALDALAAVLGVVYADDVLDVIFSRFCIGK